MDKKDLLLLKINNAITKYEAENQVPPLAIISGFKPLDNMTIREVLVVWDSRLQPMEFEVV